MNPDEARSWLQEIETLNDQLDVEARGSISAVQAVQTSSSGSIVDQLCTGISEMINAEANLVNAFANLGSSIAEIVTAAGEAAGNISDLISKVLPFMGL